MRLPYHACVYFQYRKQKDDKLTFHDNMTGRYMFILETTINKY